MRGYTGVNRDSSRTDPLFEESDTPRTSYVIFLGEVDDQPGTGCPERLWSLPYQRYLKALWTQPCAMYYRITLPEQGGRTR